jgi:hypothetical protein
MVIMIDFWNKIPLRWFLLGDMMITYEFDVLLYNFKFQKMQVVNNNWLQ